MQSAREAARRIQCVNNLKQFGLAMHNYVSANNELPFRCGLQRQCRPLLVQQLRQQLPEHHLVRVDHAVTLRGGTMFNAFNFAIGSEGTTHLTGYAYGLAVNSTVLTTRIGFFQCPSDTDKTLDIMSTTVRGHPGHPGAVDLTKGNYGVNWGNTDYGQGQRGDSYFKTNPSLHRKAPFGYNQGATGPLMATMASMTDGTSNTLLMSELLQGANDDIRGLLWTDFPGSHSFSTRLAPNGNVDFWAGSAYLDPAGGDNMDNLPTIGGSETGHEPGEPRQRRLVRQPARLQPSLLRARQRRGMLRRQPEPPSRRGQLAAGRWLGPVLQELGQSPDLGRLGSMAGGEVVSADSY